MVGLEILLLSIGAAAAVLLAGFAFTGGDTRLEARLARASQQAKPVAGPAASIRLVSKDSNIAIFDRLLQRVLPNREKLRQRLARTGRKISLGEYILASVLLTAGAGLAVWRLFGAAPLLAAPLGVAIGLLVPHLVVGFMGARRNAKFLDAFPDAIDLMVRGLRSGLPIIESIMTVGRELPAPVGTEFAQAGDHVRMGRSLEDSLWDVAQRLDVPEFRFLIITLSIQRETGGNLAETLTNLSSLLRRRRQMKLKIKALSSEARASAWIIGSLPFLMYGILSIMNPKYAGALIHDPRGLMMTGAGLLFIAVGCLVMAKMVRFEI